MSLGKTLGVFFTKQNKQSGSAIYMRDGVTLQQATRAGSVVARVRDLDGSVYQTILTPVGHGHRVSCTCPEMSRGFGYCRHVWAAALAADDQVAAAGRAASPAWSDHRPGGRVGDPRNPYARPTPQASAEPAWKSILARLEHPSRTPPSPYQGELIGVPYYVLDIADSRRRGAAILRTYQRSVRQNGSLGKFKQLPVSAATINRVREPVDRVLIGFLAGLGDTSGGVGYPRYYYGYGSRSEWAIDASTLRGIVPVLRQSGRFCQRLTPEQDPTPLEFVDGPPWELVLCVAPRGEAYTLGIEFHRGSDRRAASDFALIVAGSRGLCIADARLYEVETYDCGSDIMRQFAAHPFVVPRQEVEGLVKELLSMHHAPRLVLPDQWALTTVTDIKPAGQVELTMDTDRVVADVSYRYGEFVVPGLRQGRTVIDAAHRRQIMRDAEAEAALTARLSAAGFKTDRYDGTMTLSIRRMPEVVRELSQEGWTVLADGQLFRKAGEVEIEVTSGIDWFDVAAAVDFGGVKIGLPELLKALRSGQKYVRLGDGTLGMLPEEWLQKHSSLLDLASVEEGKLRFTNTQVLLLDALLAEQKTVRVDELFAQTRDRLRAFDGVRPGKADATFRGTLRPYQEQGLGWMGFLEQFGWGGCLADDMGLGKTVQVLAYLAGRKAVREANGKAAANSDATAQALQTGAAPDAGAVAAGEAAGAARSAGSDLPVGARASAPRTAAAALGRVLRGESVAAASGPEPASGNGYGNGHSNGKTPGTSLVVVPKSLVHNWVAEAQRFTPSLRVMIYHGSERHERLPKLGEQDLIVTTYHTLRNDIADFSKREFDYVILDEAQSIKNSKAQIAKSVRLLKARRRLALSGTPVENQLADLWSLFEFLNPGMLGALPAFRGAFGSGREGGKEGLDTLRRALRPFMLRRTKEQVATDLPPKTEETLWCEMTPGQQKRYDELRLYYRAAVLGKVDAVGLAKSKIMVLEALLRLRQAACHPRLLNDKIDLSDSGKAEALVPMLKEVIEGGHKALVFSQFTSFLAIIRSLLDGEKITYEYLDGQTRDRQERVQRFQAEPDCRLFLISLKAGGLGLNLTAADYVFILDPWWNPAVEAQAIDRTHRIGQDKKVIAYRMIAKGTVEEKILELQKRKRDLAAAIITEANSLISELTREDLEVLLS